MRLLVVKGHIDGVSLWRKRTFKQALIKLFKIKILILIFLALSCTQLVADEYTDGLKRATKESKPALLYFYSRY
ncbi:MAG: hypothetical protein NTX75_16435 [Proteobacteria bacterium]|nr:hypothetical protein [Pseudomonadota bacterium]